MTIWTTRAWFSVEEAAKILRVRRNSLYEACASGDFPCMRFGGASGSWYVRIPCEALRMRLEPQIKERSYNLGDAAQLELPLDPTCLVPVKRYRNTREIVQPWAYEYALWRSEGPRGA